MTAAKSSSHDASVLKPEVSDSCNARDEQSLSLSPWQEIGTAPKGEPGEAPVMVLLAWTYVDERGEVCRHLVGEAYWAHEDGYGGAWWWANTSPGDYYSSPIIDSITGQITHWMPVPPPPAEGGDSLSRDHAHTATAASVAPQPDCSTETGKEG